VPGSAAAAQGFGEIWHAHDGLGRQALRVDVRDARGVEELHALGEQLFPIRCEGARVGVEVLARAELQRD
jgi:hypothetical protein